MSNTIYGLTSYYGMFKSPVSTYQMNPVSNLLYGSIASSVYTRTVAKNAQSSVSSYLTSLNGMTSALRASAKPLSADSPASSYSKKSVTSSDGAAVSGTAAWNADAKTYSITVSKLASAQINKGTELKSDNASVFSQGNNSFTIKSNGAATKVSFSVNAGDTNKIVLNRMAESINKANAGISAKVITDEKTGTSRLSIDSSETGVSNAFSLEDETGNAVAASGANTVQDQARNANYILDGKQYTQETNTITLNNGKVKITLNKADNKEIKLTVGTDSKGIEEDIRKFINSYNNVVSLSNKYADQLAGAEKLGDDLKVIVNNRRNTLANIGISINGDNTLELDETKLSRALDSNPQYVKEAFSGYDGIAGRVYSKSSEVLAAPLKYSQPNLFGMGYSNYMNAINGENRFPTSGNPGQNDFYAGLVLDMIL